ncbi:MAG: queuosine precursor transporter [Bacteroidales bacterium]|nr:queuosine precursor transporter [Bacteroidales bacterium]
MTLKNKQVSVLFMLLVALFTLCLTAANLFATKQITVGPANFTGALLVFPISYIINDVVAEVYGFRRARLLIWLAFGMNFFFVLMGALVDIIPGADWWQQTPAGQGFHAIFGLAPRIVVASFLAFLVGSFINAAVISKMKVRDRGRRFPLRAIVSTLAGEACDSIIFFPIALLGIVPLAQMPLFVLWQVTLKTLYEILILPVTVRVVNAVKRVEKTDVFDVNIKYRLFK